MNKNEICEALCALPGGAVVRRRKPFSMPLVMLFAGAALIVANRIWGTELNNDLRSALVFVGGVLAIHDMIRRRREAGRGEAADAGAATATRRAADAVSSARKSRK